MFVMTLKALPMCHKKKNIMVIIEWDKGISILVDGMSPYSKPKK
jgi:hypothetical protein